MSVAEILLAAADKVETGWCQGYLAVDRDGEDVRVKSDEAICWCASGAIIACSPGVRSSEAAASVFRSMVGGSIADWNDDPARVHGEVVAKLRAAADAQEVPA